jgi:tetratricopeptide (TPR) repeat protein
MKTLGTLILAVLCMATLSCTSSNGAETVTTASAVSVPKLPERGQAMGLPGEAARAQAQWLELKRQLEKHPDDDKSWLKLCELFISEARITGNYAGCQGPALDVLDKLIAGHAGPDAKQRGVRGEAITLKALIRLNQHRFSEALTLGREAIALDPRRAFNYGILVDANVELGNYKEAVAMSDSMVAIRPDLRSYGRISYLREIFGDLTGAQQAMELAVSAGYPGSEDAAWCRVQLGGLQERQGKLEAAAQQYRQALAERPDYPHALAALGRVEGKWKHYAAADSLLRKALQQMPDAHFHEMLARVCKAHGDVEGYAAHVRSAEQLLTGPGGSAHAHAGTQAHEHAHDAHGHDHEAGLELARYELEFHKDLPAALEVARHEAELRGNNNEVNAVLAAIRYAQGDWSAARAHLRAAQGTGSRSAELLLLEGLITLKEGRTGQGRTILSHAFAMDPWLQHPLADEGRKLL